MDNFLRSFKKRIKKNKKENTIQSERNKRNGS